MSTENRLKFYFISSVKQELQFPKNIFKQFKCLDFISQPQIDLV